MDMEFVERIETMLNLLHSVQQLVRNEYPTGPWEDIPDNHRRTRRMRYLSRALIACQKATTPLAFAQTCPAEEDIVDELANAIVYAEQSDGSDGGAIHDDVTYWESFCTDDEKKLAQSLATAKLHGV